MSVAVSLQDAAEKKAAAPAAKIKAGGVKKGRNAGTKVITANDLFTGEPIYWTADQNWSADLHHALILEGEAALSELEKAAADEARSVGPYLMDVDQDRHPSGRGQLREDIRNDGPSIHPQFARQAREA
ncbi:MAG: DUF2849 domain-containing protein [Pseudomonadota bacterium]